MEMSPNIDMLAAALAKAQGKIEGASKDGLNPHFKSRYATLASIWAAARQPLSDNGLGVVQTVASQDEKIAVTTLLTHSSGQWIKDTLTVSSGDGRPQSVGSVISYARRYQLAAMVGIAPEDDDAEAAEGRAAVSSQPSVPKPTPRAPMAPPNPHRPQMPRVASVPQEPPPLTDKDIF